MNQSKFTNADRKEAIELLKRFKEFVESKENPMLQYDVDAVNTMLDVLEDWMFIK